MKLTKSLLAATFAFTAIANAQEDQKFSLDGQFIPRSEWRDGFNYRYQPSGAAIPGNLAGREGTKGAVRTDARVALAAKYISGSFTTYLKMQEVFVFGDRRQLEAGTNDNGGVRVQEAWSDIKLADKISVKIGRQGIAYDDQRIMGTVGWAQQERTHDAAVIKYKNDGYKLDLGYSLNTTAGNVFTGSPTFFSYREMGYIYANKKYENFNLSALIINNNFQNPVSANKSNLTTAGVHFDTKLAGIKVSVNGFLQDGDQVNDKAVDNAYLASLDLGYKIDKVGLGLGAEIISGKDDATTAGFFPLFGTNHKFNGFMDRFYVGNHAGGNGLIDIHASMTTPLGHGYGLLVRGHYFKEESLTKNDLGTEIDLGISKSFKGYAIKAGYSQFFENDKFPNPAGNAKGKSTQNWAYLMLIFKPKFL